MTAYTATPTKPQANLTIGPGDTLTVTSGGSASGDTVQPGGRETVSGTAYGETISGSTFTLSTGLPEQLTASLTVATHGAVTDARVLNGASLTVFGTVSATTISGVATLSSGGQTVASPTSAVIQAGGVAYSTTVGSGADVAVDGTLHSATVQSGGSLDVFGSGTGITVLSGGTLAVALGQVSGTVLSGGTATLLGTEESASPLAFATQVSAGGLLELTNGGTDSGTVIGTGGRELVGDGSEAFAPVVAGGTLELASGGTFTTVTFSGAAAFGSGGTLLLDGTAAPGGTIAGFTVGDEIVFAGLPADPAAFLAVSGNTVTLTADGVSDMVTLAGASALPLSLGTDAATGGEAIGVACYCVGTAILTSQGDVPVETIAPGDLVITADGRAEPVLWVGRRSYGGRFLAGQPHLLPIRITAGALGGRLPRRDLLVSPCHAMALDGVLIPARLLVNGQTITQERRTDRVDYVHIELARHDLILAEGAPSETYLDRDNRGLFTTASGHPGPGAATKDCAPRVTDGYTLETVRQRLTALSLRHGQAA